METYGFLPEYPIVVTRGRSGKYVVKEGQHRLALAEELGLPVYYTEATTDYDVGFIAGTGKAWKIADHAHTFAAKGNKEYQRGLEFISEHNLPVSTGFAILAGTSNWSNMKDQFYSGGFIIRDDKWAKQIVALYVPLAGMAPCIKNKTRLLEACMMVCRVPGFDPERLLKAANRCRDSWVPYSNKKSYLTMLETIYNFGSGKGKKVALKVMAENAMASRNPKNRGKAA